MSATCYVCDKDFGGQPVINVESKVKGQFHHVCKDCHNKLRRSEGKVPIRPELAPQGQSVCKDPINPSHYREHPSGVECITITQHENFCIGNAIKYLWRRRKKDVNKEVEDLRKAVWYIQQEIVRLTDGGQEMSKAQCVGKQYTSLDRNTLPYPPEDPANPKSLL